MEKSMMKKTIFVLALISVCIASLWAPVLSELTDGAVSRKGRFLLSAEVDNMIFSAGLSDLQQSVFPSATLPSRASPLAATATYSPSQPAPADDVLSPSAFASQPLQTPPQQQQQQGQQQQTADQPAAQATASLAVVQQTGSGCGGTHKGAGAILQQQEDGTQQPLKEAAAARKSAAGKVRANSAAQLAQQSEVKEAALSKDTIKAEALAAVRAASPKPPILLIHGGAQGGWAWSYPGVDASRGVVGVLQDAGYVVYAPTLPYHEPGTQWSPDQGTLKAQDYVDYIIQYMEAESITDAVVVAHSVSGVWLQLLLGQVPERISRACFLNAVVLKSGESFISNAVGPAQLFFSLMFTYPSFPQPLSWPTGAVDLQAWKEVMITLEKDNDSFAVETYKMLVPEPAGPQLEQPDFGAFYRTPKPKFFIFEQDDVSLLLGTNRWLDFAARLQDGAGPAAVIRVTGDHQGMLTRPASIAQGILQAATAPLL